MAATPLPAHAVAEIEAADEETRPGLEAWWAAWAAVGDAKTNLEATFAQLVEAEHRLRVCRHGAGMLDVPEPDCGCGRCHARWLEILEAREAAKVAVAAAELAFKET